MPIYKRYVASLDEPEILCYHLSKLIHQARYELPPSDWDDGYLLFHPAARGHLLRALQPTDLDALSDSMILFGTPVHFRDQGQPPECVEFWIESEAEKMLRRNPGRVYVMPMPQPIDPAMWPVTPEPTLVGVARKWARKIGRKR